MSRNRFFVMLILSAPLVFGMIMVLYPPEPEVPAPELLAPLPVTRVSAQGLGDHLPLMIRWSNWRAEFGPALVYAREQDLPGMLRLDAPVTKMVMVTSYREASRLMERADELHAAGVMVIGLNTENGPGMTPRIEMQTLNSLNPDVNVVTRTSSLATQHGFRVLWGPLRNVLDQVDDDVIRIAIDSGLQGIAIQEQKFIEVEPAGVRIAAVEQTMTRYRRIAAEMGVADFSIHVQIMEERCPNLANCVEFVRRLEAIPVDSIAIWSNGPISTEFVSAIRSQ